MNQYDGPFLSAVWHIYLPDLRFKMNHVVKGWPYAWVPSLVCFMGLLTDMLNCGLCMRGECREHFPRRRLQMKPLISGPEMHHGTCVTHVPWCMSGSLTRGGGENVPGIAGACATLTFTYLVRGPCMIQPGKSRKSQQFTLSAWSCIISISLAIFWWCDITILVVSIKVYKTLHGYPVVPFLKRGTPHDTSFYVVIVIYAWLQIDYKSRFGHYLYLQWKLT